MASQFHSSSGWPDFVMLLPEENSIISLDSRPTCEKRGGQDLFA